MLHLNTKIVIVGLLFISTTLGAVERRIHFLEFGPGVAASARGDAATASGSDTSSIYYNPALLTNLTGDQLYVSHWYIFDGARYSFIGFSSAWENHAIAFAGTGLTRNNIELYSADAVLSSTLAESSQLAAYGAYSSYIQSIDTNYGITAKYISYEIFGNTGNGFAIDGGLSKTLFTSNNSAGSNFSIDAGVAFQNYLQTPLKMISEEEPFPKIVRFGLSSNIIIPHKSDNEQNLYNYNTLIISADFINTDNQLLTSFGLEYKVNKLLTLRGGFNEGLTAGFGIKFMEFEMDYSYIPKDFFAIHKMGFSMKFGQGEIRG